MRTSSSVSKLWGMCPQQGSGERGLPEDAQRPEAELPGPLPHPRAHGLQAWERLSRWMRT